MKTLLPLCLLAALCGCQSARQGLPPAAAPAPERGYAFAAESRARSLVRSQQAPTLSDARELANDDAHVDQAKTTRDNERRAAQAKFEKDLSAALGAGK